MRDENQIPDSDDLDLNRREVLASLAKYSAAVAGASTVVLTASASVSMASISGGGGGRGDHGGGGKGGGDHGRGGLDNPGKPRLDRGKNAGGSRGAENSSLNGVPGESPSRKIG